MSFYQSLRWHLPLVIVGITASHSLAQLPATHLVSVFPAGAQAGQTVEVDIAGEDLDDVDAITLSHQGSKD